MDGAEARKGVAQGPAFRQSCLQGVGFGLSIVQEGGSFPNGVEVICCFVSRIIRIRVIVLRDT